MSQGCCDDMCRRNETGQEAELEAMEIWIWRIITKVGWTKIKKNLKELIYVEKRALFCTVIERNEKMFSCSLWDTQLAYDPNLFEGQMKT